MAATAESLQAEFAPLTEAEANLVLRRLEESDEQVADVVAAVKADRVGPAAHWEDTPEPAADAETEPEGDVPTEPVVVMDPDTKIETFEEVAEAVAEDDGQGTEVPEGTVTEILDWVGEDPVRAQQALDAELARDDARSTLLSALEPVAGEEVEP